MRRGGVEAGWEGEVGLHDLKHRAPAEAAGSGGVLTATADIMLAAQVCALCHTSAPAHTSTAHLLYPPPHVLHPPARLHPNPTPHPRAALICGFCAAFIFEGTCVLLLRLRVDDVVSAGPMHGCCGAWGVLFVGLLAKEVRGRGETGREGGGL